MHIFRYINQTLIGFLEILALMNNASTLLGKGGGGGGWGGLSYECDRDARQIELGSLWLGLTLMNSKLKNTTNYELL